MAFVKLDTQILDSTVWVDREAREMFITALLLAHPYEAKEPMPQIHVRSLENTGYVIPPGWYGFVPAAGVGIARRAMVEMEAGLAALERLGDEDPESRSSDFGGRRLVRVDGGYLLLNYVKYRDRDHTTAARSRRYRDKKKALLESNAFVTTDTRDDVTDTRDEAASTRDVTHAYAYAYADLSTSTKTSTRTPTPPEAAGLLKKAEEPIPKPEPPPSKPLTAHEKRKALLAAKYPVPPRPEPGLSRVADILPRQPANLVEWLQAFHVVMREVREGLYRASENLGTKGHPNLKDGVDEWKLYFDDMEVVEFGLAEGSETKTMLTVECAEPKTAGAGLLKYRTRISDAMKKQLGVEFQIKLQRRD